MVLPHRRRARWRWLVPGSLLAAIVGVAGFSQLVPAGASSPDLPPISALDLLVRARTARVDGLSGTVRLTTRLGLPDVAGLGPLGGSSTPLVELLSGSHTARVAIDGPDHVRVALIRPSAEADWIRNGDDLWAWDSSTQHVVHARAARPDGWTPGNSTPGRSAPDPARPDADAADGSPELTPPQLAQHLLDEIDPSTQVSVQATGEVAGRPVYELAVAPRSDASTVAQVVVSVDSETGLPLEVTVTAKGAPSPAIDLGFSSLSLDRPADSTFAFAPPPGATVTEAPSPMGLLGRAGRSPDHREHRRAARPRATGSTEQAPGLAPAPAGNRVTTVGEGWDRVAVLDHVDLGHGFDDLLHSAPTVTTARGGTGRLITTALVNVVVLDDGRVAIGAVRPAALQAAVPAP